MDFLILGINHRTASLEVRENISFSPGDAMHALVSLQKYPQIRECLILSTCNRVELYALVEDKIEGLNNLRRFIYDYHNLNLEESLEEYFYSYGNQRALEHLFRVSSSLDSMIVGENQILQQVKQAYFNAYSSGAAGQFLSLSFQEALRVGKKVRTQTDIGKGSVSISSAAVALAKKALKNLEGKTILIIGAGKIGELTVKNLTNRGIELILVANRTYKQAVKLAELFAGKAIRFEQLYEALTDVDIIISSTSAPHYILKYDQIISAMGKRSGEPLFLIDLGVPRNIEQSISKIKGIHLYNIDDLKKMSELNLKGRLKESYKAEKIVREEAECFYNRVLSISLHECEFVSS